MRVTPVRHCRPRAFTRSARGPAGPGRGRMGGGGVAVQRPQRRGAAACRRARLGCARGARAARRARARGAAPGGARGRAGGARGSASAAARRARQGAAVGAAAGAGAGARAGPRGRGAARAGDAAARAARAADAHRGRVRGARPCVSCARRPPPRPCRSATTMRPPPSPAAGLFGPCAGSREARRRCRDAGSMRKGSAACGRSALGTARYLQHAAKRDWVEQERHDCL